MARGAKTGPKSVETLTHGEESRRNIPTVEYHPVLSEEEKAPIRVAFERRNRDLDPQLVWRGKDEQDAADLVVQAPPLYIQEKLHPKVLIDDLLRQTKERREEETPPEPSLFADFNGLPNTAARTEFYRHDANWSNRMILGDSLQVMASLAEREGLRGKVQCIYIDPPYGIRFNSNFQWSTTSRDVKDGKAEHITREPEQVKAFRDTWRDGIHSYLAYLRDRLTVARELLTESGSVFVQIGDENVHRVRMLMDEVFEGGGRICQHDNLSNQQRNHKTELNQTHIELHCLVLQKPGSGQVSEAVVGKRNRHQFIQSIGIGGQCDETAHEHGRKKGPLQMPAKFTSLPEASGTFNGFRRS